MKKTFPGVVWSNFRKVQGLIGGGLVVSAIFWFFQPDTMIPSKIAIPILIILILVVVTLANSTYESLNFGNKILPAILYARKANQKPLLCLLEPSELFSQDILVSLYFRDEDGFEILVGIGKVKNIQENGKIQIEMLNHDPIYEDIMKKLENNDINIMKRFQVKPHIPDRYLQYN